MLAQRADRKAGLSSPRSCTPAPLLLSPGSAAGSKLDTETEMGDPIITTRRSLPSHITTNTHFSDRAICKQAHEQCFAELAGRMGSLQ